MCGSLDPHECQEVSDPQGWCPRIRSGRGAIVNKLEDTLKFLITDPFFSWISVVETDYKFSIVHLGKVLIEDDGLGMADMQVATWFWWKAGNDLSMDRVLQPEGEASSSFVRPDFVCLGGS